MAYVPDRHLAPFLEPFLPFPTGALCFDAYDLGSGGILPAEHPHENKLHHVAVKEEELRPPVALRAVHGLHAARRGGRGGVREEDVFEGTELAGLSSDGT